jgi:hypothetical protein
MFHVLRLNADAAIFNRNNHFIVFLPSADRDYSAVRIEGIRRISQQIKKDLFNLVGNRLYLWQSARIIPFHRNTFAIQITFLQDQYRF